MQYILHLLSGLSDTFMSLLSDGGYWVLSIVLLLEALPIIGSFVPGHVLIIAAGFLVKLGVLNFGIIFITSTIAVIIGDVIGFLLGRRYGNGALYRLGKFFRVKEEYIEKTLEKTKSMIASHPGKTIILGKFSPVTRPFTPFLVGAQGIHIRTFWIYNIIGGVIWIFASMMIGYIFGASYHAAASYFGKLMVGAIIIAIFIIWGFRIANARFHIFKKYELFVLSLNIIALWALAKTIQDSFSIHSFMSNFDIATNIFMVKYVTLPIARIGLWISAVGGTSIMLFLGFSISAFLVIRQKWRRAGIMLLSIISTSVVVFVMKELFMRARPHNALVVLHDASFPSAHASLSAAFFTALAYLLIPRIHSWVKREGCIVLFVLIVALIGMSRIVLNVHWASDVIAGWALGVFLATASILFVRYTSVLFIKKQK